MQKLLEVLDKVTTGIKNEILLFSIAVIILLIITPVDYKFFVFSVYIFGVIGFIVYTKIAHRKEEIDLQPQVHADISKSSHYTLLEILNTGSENIINLRVAINWNQTEGPQDRQLTRFFREGENPITMSARDARSLRVGERVYADSIPLYSTDGQIRVSITGEGAASHKSLEYSTTIENEVRPS